MLVENSDARYLVAYYNNSLDTFKGAVISLKIPSYPNDFKMISMNIERIFSDTSQQGNTDGELSCILYLKVPEQISGMVEVPGWGMIADGTAGETTEGFTHLTWGDISEPSLLKPVTEQYLKPQVGKMIMFPSWLMHCVDPNQSNDIRISVSFNFLQKGMFV